VIKELVDESLQFPAILVRRALQECANASANRDFDVLGKENGVMTWNTGNMLSVAIGARVRRLVDETFDLGRHSNTWVVSIKQCTPRTASAVDSQARDGDRKKPKDCEKGCFKAHHFEFAGVELEITKKKKKKRVEWV
jgi:hypothetical protein